MQNELSYEVLQQNSRKQLSSAWYTLYPRFSAIANTIPIDSSASVHVVVDQITGLAVEDSNEFFALKEIAAH